MTACIVELGPPDISPTLAEDSVVPALGENERRLHAPDAHVLLMDGDRALARCSCWWNGVPTFEGQTLGTIGHYAARDGAAAAALLSYACERLRRANCTYAVGPMDGNTWRNYRLVTERGSEPPFFLEPWTPEEWVGHWRAGGFLPIAEYTSAMNDDLSREDPRVPRAIARLTDTGVSFRGLNLSQAEADLRAIFSLSLESFRRNFLYTPLDETEFLEQNGRLLPLVRPELVLLAEREGALAGFAFAVPDLLQARRGSPVDTIVVKTVAVAASAPNAGLGSVLVARVQQIARDLGFRRAI
ncbi:MAG TPA: GNAT family N-acetyltransferase, partial [Vicinamibacterales bacterium]|nr:GNAT family N-acetyltransferase [Vicinamibacterales bacterium]